MMKIISQQTVSILDGIKNTVASAIAKPNKES
jgi:hypothetical protein